MSPLFLAAGPQAGIQPVKWPAAYDNAGFDGSNQNTAAGLIYADSGALPAGLYEITWMVNLVNVGDVMSVRWMDSVPTIKKEVQIGSPVQPILVSGTTYILMVANDRIRMVSINATASRASAYLSWRRIAP